MRSRYAVATPYALAAFVCSLLELDRLDYMFCRPTQAAVELTKNETIKYSLGLMFGEACTIESASRICCGG